MKASAGHWGMISARLSNVEPQLGSAVLPPTRGVLAMMRKVYLVGGHITPFLGKGNPNFQKGLKAGCRATSVPCWWKGFRLRSSTKKEPGFFFMATRVSRPVPDIRLTFVDLPGSRETSALSLRFLSWSRNSKSSGNYGRSPSALLSPLLGEGSPTKIDYRKGYQPLYWRT